MNLDNYTDEELVEIMDNTEKAWSKLQHTIVFMIDYMLDESAYDAWASEVGREVLTRLDEGDKPFN